jgi:hypothetical protein
MGPHRVTAEDSTWFPLNNEWRIFRSTILRTKEQRLVHIVSSGFYADHDASLTTRIVGAPPFSGLSQSIMQTLSFADKYFASEHLATREEEKNG